MKGGTTGKTTERSAPDALAPPPHHPRFPLLDGMRAIAALCILLFHVSLLAAPGDEAVTRVLRNLSIGVPIFFLISGFLLYRPFIAHRTGGAAGPAIRDYARRRALRIFPAFWVIMAVLVLAPGFAPFDGQPTIWDALILHQLPLPGNDVCQVTLDTCGLAQTWSLTVEVAFYAALPIYVIAAAVLANGRDTRRWLRAELLLLLLLSVASLALAYFTVEPGRLSWVGGSVLGYVFWFALGMGLALVSVAIGDDERISRFANRFAGWLWLAAAALFAALIIVVPPETEVLGAGERTAKSIVVGAIALLLLFPAIFAGAGESVVARVLSWRACAWLGLISYGIFLWHFVVIQRLGAAGLVDFVPLLVATLAITVALAAASYYLVERPVLRFKYRRRSRKRVDSGPPHPGPLPYPPGRGRPAG